MSRGKAIAIFEGINEYKVSKKEKLEAIQTVLDMETHNSITKQEILNALSYTMGLLGGAADLDPSRHGKWIKTDTDFNDMPMEEFKCSVCGNTTCNLTDTAIPLPKFCDECGTKMDGGKDN